MSYQAKRSDEEQQHNDQSNANAVRTAAAVASASGHPVATAVGKGVQLGDKLTDGKISEGLGKGLSKANDLMPGGKYSQDALNKLNDSGINDKIGDAAFAYHKYKDNAAQNEANNNKKQPSKGLSSNSSDDSSTSDDNGTGNIKGQAMIKAAAAISAIVLLPLFICIVIIMSVTNIFTNFEDAMGAGYVNNESVGGLTDVAMGSKDAEAFYKRISEVREDMAQKGMVFESTKIVAVYNIIINENNDFTYKKMTKSRIREIAEAMFKKEQDSNGEAFYIYDEEVFKDNLKNDIYKKLFPSYSAKKLEEMAKKTIEYIDDYYSFIGESPSDNTASGPYSNWKQYEGSWTNVKLGSSGKTIKQIGCAATSVAMLIAKSGVETTVNPLTPGTFVEKMSQNGGFGSGSCLGCINWAKTTTVAPRFQYTNRITVSGYSKTEKFETLKNLLNSNYYVVAEVKGTTGEHWVAIDKIEGNNIKMLDPGSTSTNLWQEYPWQNTSTFVYYRVV